MFVSEEIEPVHCSHHFGANVGTNADHGTRVDIRWGAPEKYMVPSSSKKSDGKKGKQPTRC